jgi:SulP family sulfate permease
VNRFTNGIALVIASTQLKDFFGIPLENVPGIHRRITALVGAMNVSFDTDAARGVCLLLTIVVWNRLVPRVRLHRGAESRTFVAALAPVCRWRPSAAGSVVSRPAAGDSHPASGQT